MEEQKDLLIEEEIYLTPAQPALRFVNYLIDVIVYYIILVAIALLNQSLIDPSNVGALYLVIFGVLIGYFTIMEGATNGKTLGKLITKTRAVKEDGSPITFGDAALRSLCRLVPFEPFSAFGGHPWHDKWTKTMVVKQ